MNDTKTQPDTSGDHQPEREWSFRSRPSRTQRLLAWLRRTVPFAASLIHAALWVRRHRALVTVLAVTLLASMLLLLPMACEPQGRKLPQDVAPVERQLLDAPPGIRVLLASRLTASDMPRLEVSGPVDFKTPEGKLIRHVPRLNSSALSVQAGRLRIGQLSFAEPVILLRTGSSGCVRVGARRYRGDLEIRRNARSRVTLINHLDLESYLRGVVAGEMPNWWPTEALRAQTVVSRSYAYALIVENDGAGTFDVTASYKTSQVYEGLAGETAASDRAVKDTRGLLLTYRGEPFRAYFCSTCGGHTEACGLTWDDYPTIAPLSGVSCPYCVDSKWYVPWEVSFTETSLRQSLKRAGYNILVIKDIQLDDRNADGHNDWVRISHAGGTLRISGNDFRLAVGPGKLKSTMCRVSRQSGSFVFSGRGYGHGVGMCQFGAQGMVKQGKLWEEVVHHYYPGCEIWRIYH